MSSHNLQFTLDTSSLRVKRTACRSKLSTISSHHIQFTLNQRTHKEDSQQESTVHHQFTLNPRTHKEDSQQESPDHHQFTPASSH